ncbi:MAG: hypothetical protein JWN44_3238 [Myxococcales bacterium]|nr:hypothetical protein [Myxococcales bacterium]
MTPNQVQLAWPFALIGGAVGAQLPSAPASAILMALVLGVFGALISSALDRVRDWQVALMSPFVGAATGATIGWGLDGFDGGAIGLIAGLGFGLLALPPLILITDGARRAARLPERSLLGQAQRRRVWLLALSTSALASLAVPALANPWSRPSEAPMAQLCALATMLMAIADASIWVTMTQQTPPPPTDTPSANPYRESAMKPPRVDDRMIGIRAAESLLYDALIVAVVAAALLVSR